MFARALFRTRAGDPLLTMPFRRQLPATRSERISVISGLFDPERLPPIAIGCNRRATSVPATSPL